MSLIKQLFLAICLFLAAAFTGSFLVGVENSREQLVSQLRSHAQDAATALGLSLTPHIDDPAMVELMVSSIFDSGYFASIRVLGVADGQIMVERQMQADTRVPEWFAGLVDLQPAGGEALVMRGWQQAARIEAISHPQFALARLWDAALGSLFWLLLCGLLSAVLGGWLLQRQLRPLQQMTLQAEAITRREFLALGDIPRTPELRRVVLAMNQMVEKLRSLFAEEAARSERLRDEAYRDPLTGLANRRLLLLHLHTRLAANEINTAGSLLLLQVNDLAGLNQRRGATRSDALLTAIATLLEHLGHAHGHADWLAARSRGGEFALLAPGLSGEERQALTSELLAGLEQLRATDASDCTPVAFLGLTAFQPGEDDEQVLARTDLALAQARLQPEQPCACLDDSHPQPSIGLHDWHQWLDEALDAGRLLLYFQPVADCRDISHIRQHKVLARLLAPDGQTIPAARFLPWIARLDWSARLDLLMLEHLLSHLRHQPAPLALSLSAETLRDTTSLERLLHLLRSHPQQAPLLTLELDERSLPPREQLEPLCQSLRATGYGLALQHCGGHFSRIGNLAHLGLAYLKLDGSYIRNIHQDADKRLFIEAVRRTTHSIDLPLIAEMVEHEGELRILCELGLDAVMGRLIGAPEPAQGK